MVNLQTEYELSADEMGMVQPMIDTVQNVQKELQCILNAIVRLRNLQGSFSLVGNKLIKADQNGNGIPNG